MSVFVSCFEIFGPQISVLDPYVFQYGVSVPLPSPSTFAGALAYAYATGSSKSFTYALNDLLDSVEKNPLCLSITVTIPPDSWLVKTRFILRRNRFLDDDHIPKWEENKISLGKKKWLVNPPPSFNYYYYYQRDLFDALYREYIFVPKLIVFVVTDNENINQIVKQYMPYVFRLGDTESLVATKYIYNSEEPIPLQTVEKGGIVEHVNTLTAASRKDEVYLTPEGDYIVSHGMPIHALRRREDGKYVSRQIHFFLCPLKIKQIRNRYQVYEPSEFVAKMNEKHYLIDVRIRGDMYRIVIPIKYFNDD
ncbi:MAG: type I-A CRISPR-associated protein Cas5a [Candidatus Aenigmatarchaeota archaeon]